MFRAGVPYPGVYGRWPLAEGRIHRRTSSWGRGNCKVHTGDRPTECQTGGLKEFGSTNGLRWVVPGTWFVRLSVPMTCTYTSLSYSYFFGMM